MGSVSTLQPISFLEQGLTCARAVARIVVGNTVGTGFLVANNYLITNNHVLPNSAAAATAKVQFNFQQNWLGNDLQFDSFALAPDAGFVTSTDKPATKLLDYTIVKLAEDANAAHGQLSFSDEPAVKDDFVCIIQHPAGGPKQIALYHNVVTFANDTVVQYLTDTLPGSSGHRYSTTAGRWWPCTIAGAGLKNPALQNRHIVMKASMGSAYTKF